MRRIGPGIYLLFALASMLGPNAHSQATQDANVTPVESKEPQVDAQAFLKTAGSLTEAALQNRLVVVGAPKIYDDLYLQQQLASLQTQLQNTHAVDQATLLSHIGVAQGADLRQTSTALSASGPATTTTTATASMTPTAPAPTAPTLASPSISSLGQSSLDAYNESLQLSAEITNTSLLLQGALSDQMTRTGGPKTTVTIGFPITVSAPSINDKDLAGAVAEIHVGICSGTEDDPPSIATLLPQQRTYNVASLVERNFLASASAITGGVMSIGGGFLWSHKRYYLVQQQETVALLEPQADHKCTAGSNLTGFAWQIRPVLGKEFIRPGNSVNFVQVAIPSFRKQDTSSQWPVFLEGTTGPIGQACVSVVWRKPAVTGWFGKRDERYLGDAISSGEQCYAINYYRTSPNSDAHVMISVMDVGQGMVTVTASTEMTRNAFLPGTTVRLGNSYITPVIPSTHNALEFITSANAIVAAGRVYFVGRDGREVEAVRRPAPDEGLTMGTPSISPYSDSLSKVTIAYTDPQQAPVSGDNSPQFINPAIDPLVVVIGGKVFGLGDAPFFARKTDETDKTKVEIQLIVPNSLIQSSPVIELRRLLWPDSLYRKSMAIPPDTFSKAIPAITSSSVLSSQNGLTIGLVGTGLDTLKMVFPSCQTCTAVPVGSTFLQVTLRKGTRAATAKDRQAVDPTDGLKELVFCRTNPKTNDCDANFNSLLVAVPEIDPAAPKSSLGKSAP